MGHHFSTALAERGLVRKVFDSTQREAKVFYKTLVNDKTTKDEWIRDLRMAGLENAAELAEGENIPIFKPVLDTYKTYTQTQFGRVFG